MRQQTELKWILFLSSILLISFGLIIDFSFENKFDLQMHDTFIVVNSIPLLILLISILSIQYFMSYGLKKLVVHNTLKKIVSLTIVGLIGLLFIGFLAILILTLSYKFDELSKIDYGISIYISGIIILYFLRAKEISNLK